VSLSAGTAPSEEALADAYGSIFEIMGDRPIVVRAMDVGGDKPLPFLNMSDEANPFLGWRGIRVLLDEPELFAAQIRSALRAANKHETDLRMMLPMVATVDEFVRARRLIEKVQRDSGIDLAHPLRIGAMIEVPSAALVADALAREADFFSLGTNDLTQYVLAADRTNPHVRSLCRLLHPAVLRLIDTTVRASNVEGLPVAVCGEAAGTVPELLLLVGLGVDELSVGPAQLPEVRAILRTLSYAALQSLASEALSKSTADEVVELVKASGYTSGSSGT
jgi:multiphosphoryl transfer protein